MHSVRFSRSLLAVATAVTAALLSPAALASPSPPGGQAGVLVYGKPVCGSNWVPVNTGHGRYFNVYNDTSNGTTCVLVPKAGQLAYRVTYEQHTKKNWLMTGIGEGVSWGKYTCYDGPSGTGPGTHCATFPVQVYKEGSITASAAFTPASGGRWDDGWDIWFNKTYVAPSQLQQPNGTEIMIRMHDRAIAITPYRTVTIDHHVWYVEHWRSCAHGVCWRYVAYVAKYPGNRTWNLSLTHIFADAVKRGDLHLTWYLTGIMFGEEAYSGGAGFAVTMYNLTGVR
jgi:hypothetical protein